MRVDVAPAPEMRRSSSRANNGPRGQQQGDSASPLRPFTPPDLSSIPHMDEASQQQLGERSAHNPEELAPKQAGPYIIGSPIDLGAVDNVDSINLRLQGHKRLTGKRQTGRTDLQHIELRESQAERPPPTNNQPGRDSRSVDQSTIYAGDEPREERVIFVNAPQQPATYRNNHISTAKYSLLSFVPSFLFEQFRRYSNCFFLFVALMQQIPDVSPTGRYTTLVPLVFILSVSALKEIVEDIKRHRADDEINKREVNVLRDGRWEKVQWKLVGVGDVLKVRNNNFFPADMILLSSSEPQSMSFIETANLDGETNLKIRQAHPSTAELLNTNQLMNFRANIQCEPPNRHLYEFNGVLRETNKPSVSLGPDQLLLRGAMLRNTRWVFGVVIYTGHDTKLMQNNTSAAPLKRSTLDRLINTQILMLFFMLIVLCLITAIFNAIWSMKHSDWWYLGLSEEKVQNFAFNLMTFMILFNNLIPISLQVTLEVVRYMQASFINMDIEMYHEETNTPAMARTSNLNEELGMVSYIFTDKTGTLTRNVMEFKRCSIAGKVYCLPPVSNNEQEGERYCELLQDVLQGAHMPFRPPQRSSTGLACQAEIVHEFMIMLAVCHTVIPEKQDGNIIYHAASPDERALVDGAQKFGYVFDARTPHSVEIAALGERFTYEILNVIEFTSARKRMSVIVRTPDGNIKLFCKGADTVIYERLLTNDQFGDVTQDAEYRDTTLEHLEAFASEGLRTLCFASVDITEEKYNWWKNIYDAAATSLTNREEQIEEAANLIEKELILLGATAIEDQLQDQVPETIESLIQADINVWILTGDKQETAINIGYSCKLITQSMPLIIVNEDSLDKTRDVIIQRCLDFGQDLKCQNDVGLVIDGNSLKYALSCDLRRDFLDLCTSCKVVICCRVSPMQKAEVVDLVTTNTEAVTLAIGDGANDVAMIQKAHIGVGISGVEGLQAACASDYSIAQFRFLKRLLLVHGSWNYTRMCKLVLYSFYKNICLYVIELWFAIYSGWSGQILFERWSLGLYNVLFTAAPPLAIGLFDKECSSDTHLAHPCLYAAKNATKFTFNFKVFWIWIINALLHSALLYWLSLFVLSHDVIWQNGREGGYLILGNFVYTFVIATVCGKAGLITTSWTWVTHLSIWGSIILWFLFILIYSNFWPIVNVGAVMCGNDRMLFSSPVFWLSLVFIPFVVLLPDLLIEAVKNSVWTSLIESAREQEIRKSDPAALLTSQDYRSSSSPHIPHPNSYALQSPPKLRNNRYVRALKYRGMHALRKLASTKLTETARLLKNVKSVFTRRSNAATRVNVEVELSHGFAFSQEEGGTVSQTDVIRAYNTNLPKPGGM